MPGQPPPIRIAETMIKIPKMVNARPVLYNYQPSGE